MPGINYVGADYSKDGNPYNLVNKIDVDSEFADNPVSQTAVASQINTAITSLASQTSVNNALAAYIQPNYITTAVQPLIPLTSVGEPSALATTYTVVSGDTISSIASNFGVSTAVLESANPLIPNFNTLVVGQLVNIPAIAGVAPLNAAGIIPASFTPSLGEGYCLGPFGPTAIFDVADAGATPVKIADWSIGVQSIAFQPMVFMSLMVGAISGGRPVVEVRISVGPNTYAKSTLVARGMGRSSWNDLQAITVFPAPASAGHSGVAGTGYPPNYNTWLSAWVYDLNNQGVSVATDNIATAGVFLIRYSQ